jgi:hypothetical protein
MISDETSGDRELAVAGDCRQLCISANLVILATLRHVRFAPKALHRQIRRLFALENPAGIYSDEAISICNARPVAHQADRDCGWLLDRSGQRRRRLRVMNPGGADVKNLTTPLCGPPRPTKPELISNLLRSQRQLGMNYQRHHLAAQPPSRTAGRHGCCRPAPISGSAVRGPR